MDGDDTMNPYAWMRRGDGMSEKPGHALEGPISDRLRRMFPDGGANFVGSARIDTDSDVNDPRTRRKGVGTMTKRTKKLGNDSGKSSDRHMSPQGPYTGDGRTNRSIFDKVVNIFRSKDGKRIK